MKNILIFRKRSKGSIGFSGGGEIGIDNLQVQLEKLGYVVSEQSLPYAEGRLAYLYFVLSYIKLFLKVIICGFKSYDRFHVSIYLGSSRILEVFLLLILKLKNLQKPIVLEIRGGYIQNTGRGLVSLRLARRIADRVLTQIPFDSGEIDLDGLLPNFYEVPHDYSRIYSEVIELGYLGRIEENKGIRELLTICRILREKEIKFRCEIAGNGSLVGWLRKEILNMRLGEDVFYLGNISRKEVPTFWRTKKYFVFLTTNPYEGQSNSLTEAIVAGVLPLVSDIPVMKKLLNNQSLSFYHGDTMGVVNRIIELENNEQFRSEVYMDLGRKDFSEQRFLKELVKTYKKVDVLFENN